MCHLSISSKTSIHNWKYMLHMRSHSKNQHLGWRLVSFSLFLVTSEIFCPEYFLCKWAKILIWWCLAAVNWFWPFIVLDHIYGRSNFGHKLCLLALLAKFMAKIWAAINMAQDHKWSIPMASLLQQCALKFPVQLHVIEAFERHEKSPKNGQVVRLDIDSRSDSSYV